MRRLFIIIGIISAVVALILSVTPFFKIGYMPALAALVFGFAALYISKQMQSSKKTIYLIFLLTIISMAQTGFKYIFNSSELEYIEEVKAKEASKEILEKSTPQIDSTPRNEIEPEVLPN